MQLNIIETRKTVMNMRFVSIKEAQAKLSVGRTMLWLLCKEPGFPRLVSITQGRKVFVEAELDQWIAEKIASRDAGRAA